MELFKSVISHQSQGLVRACLPRGNFAVTLGVKGLIVQPKGFPRYVEEYCEFIYRLRLYFVPQFLGANQK